MFLFKVLIFNSKMHRIAQIHRFPGGYTFTDFPGVIPPDPKTGEG